MRGGIGASVDRFHARGRPGRFRPGVPPPPLRAVRAGRALVGGPFWRARRSGCMPEKSGKPGAGPAGSAVKRNGRVQKSPDGRLRRSQPSLTEIPAVARPPVFPTSVGHFSGNGQTRMRAWQRGRLCGSARGRRYGAQNEKTPPERGFCDWKIAGLTCRGLRSAS
jgi:hypothetical protein